MSRVGNRFLGNVRVCERRIEVIQLRLRIWVSYCAFRPVVPGIGHGHVEGYLTLLPFPYATAGGV